MNKKEFANYYKQIVIELDCPVDQAVVSAGGALLMLGLRESSSDIDLDVPAQIVKRHKSKANTEMFGTTEVVNYNEQVSLHVISSTIKTMVIDGVTLYSIPELIKQKKALLANPNRKKEKLSQDQKDIEKLEKFLNKRPASASW